jgi:hypothetical protein
MEKEQQEREQSIISYIKQYTIKAAVHCYLKVRHRQLQHENPHMQYGCSLPGSMWAVSKGAPAMVLSQR